MDFFYWEKRMDDGNLLHSVSNQEQAAVQIWLKTTFFIVVTICSMFLIIFIFMYYTLTHLRTQVRGAAQEISRTEAILANFGSLEEQRKELEERQALFDAWNEPCLVSQCLERIAPLLPEAARLVRIRLIDQGTVLLEGQALHPQAAIDFLGKMREDNWVQQALLEQLQQETSNNSPAMVVFRIKVIKA